MIYPHLVDTIKYIYIYKQIHIYMHQECTSYAFELLKVEKNYYYDFFSNVQFCKMKNTWIECKYILENKKNNIEFV